MNKTVWWLLRVSTLVIVSAACSTKNTPLDKLTGGSRSADAGAATSVIDGSIASIPLVIPSGILPVGMQPGVAPVTPKACQPSVAVTPLQRLTKAQYQATVSDLLALTTLPAIDLPPDEQQGPFNANGALQLSDLNVVQYQAAAEQLVTAAMATIESRLPCKFAAMNTACMGTFINQFGLKASRRPLTTAEQQDYATLAAPFLATGDGKTAVQAVLEAMLQSPNFLFRLEYGVAATNSVALTSYELASRLSYALVGTAPDSALLRAAADNSLTTDAGLLAQAQRLMSSPGFPRTTSSFIAQWLGMGLLGSTTKDPATYPAFNQTLLNAMQQEQIDFSTYVIQNADGRLPTLLAAPYSILTDPLFSLYGVTKPANYTPGMPVQLDPKQRAGILSQAAFLAANSHQTKTSVVLRGKIVRENMLCQSMPPPPPNVAALPMSVAPNSTARQVFAAHESNAACAGCHLLMDPIGLTMENYDAIGAWRTKEGTSVIDPSGSLKGTKSSNADVANFIGLATSLSTSPDVASCFVTQVFRANMSRLETANDQCEINNLNLAFNANKQDIRQLILAVVLSDSFRMVYQD